MVSSSAEWQPRTGSSGLSRYIIDRELSCRISRSCTSTLFECSEEPARKDRQDSSGSKILTLKCSRFPGDVPDQAGELITTDKTAQPRFDTAHP